MQLITHTAIAIYITLYTKTETTHRKYPTYFLKSLINRLLAGVDIMFKCYLVKSNIKITYMRLFKG